MKNKTFEMLLLSCVLCASAIVAQETQIKAKPTEKAVAFSGVEKEKKNSITVYGGLPGYAIGYGRKLNDHFTARVNYATFTLSQDLAGLSFSNRQVDASVDFDYQAIDLFFDFLPSKKSSFKFVVGASYLSNMETSIVLAAASDEKVGQFTVPKEQIGDVLIDAKWSGIAPYVAMGFGRTVPKHRVGFGFEIGGHFLGKSDFNLTATETLEPLFEDPTVTADFKKFLDEITFLPTIQFHLAYKF